MSSNTPTIIDLLMQQVENRGETTAMLYRPGDEFLRLTWSELLERVLRAAAGLIELGVQPGDRVATISENRMEWVVADLAIQFARAVHTPLHVQLAPSQMRTQIDHSGASCVLISGNRQAQAMQSIEPLSGVLWWCAYDELKTEIHGKPVHSFHDLGNNASAEQLSDVSHSAQREVTPDSLATILYTSGTTGEPRGVMLSQGNMTTNAIGVLEYFPQSEADVRLCFLPLSHVFARTCDLVTWLVRGSQFGIARSRETVAEDCRTLRPHSITGVPYFYEKLWRRLREAGVADAPNAINLALGDRLNRLSSGGAALPGHVFDYYESKGVPILQGYGLSETSPVITATAVGEARRGSSGRAIPGVQIKIADDGEILTRGPHLMQGYYRDEPATAATIREGWLHTGDLGRIDADGFLFITGRRKEILVTSTGKNVAPAAIEAALMQDPLIEQAMVVGDGEKHIAALLVLSLETLNARLNEPQLSSLEETVSCEATRGLLQLWVDNVNNELAHHEQVRSFAILPRAFCMEEEELTAKLSLRREVIARNFGETITALFE